MSIFEATKHRCIEEQRDAAFAAAQAAEYRRQGQLISAQRKQRQAAYHADEAMLRLDRLIGVS